MAPVHGLWLVCLLLVAAAVSDAVVITVDSTGDGFGVGDGCSLREAISNAQGGSNPDCALGSTDPNDLDEIEITVTSITLSTAGGAEDNNANGDLDIREDVVIRAVAGTCTIDAQDLFNVFHIPLADTHVELFDLHITRGAVAQDGFAGGLVNEGGVLRMTRVTFSNNQNVLPDGNASNNGMGGAIHTTGTIIMSGCAFENNLAKVNVTFIGAPIAGAIYSEAGLEIEQSTFLENVALENFTISGTISTSTSACAGAIFSRGSDSDGVATVLLEDTSFTRNSGCTGGAVLAEDSAIRMVDVVFDENTAEWIGGAIWSNRGVEWDGSANQFVQNNTATRQRGGVVYTAGPLNVKGVAGFRTNVANLASAGQGLGGVAFVGDSAVFEDIPYGFEANEANRGGVVYANGAASFKNTGDFVRNNGQGYSGISYSNDEARFVNVGELRYNTGAEYVVYSRLGDVYMNGVGDILSNSGGGAVFGGTQFYGANIGDIIDNESANGSVFAGATYATLANTGSIVRNRGDRLRASLIYGGYVSVRNVGLIYNNYYATSGTSPYTAVIQGRYEVRVNGVNGDISYNSYRGGVIRSGGACSLENVTGDISFNNGYYSSVMYCSEAALLRNVGSIASNIGVSSAGVVFGGEAARIEYVRGDIEGNRGVLSTKSGVITDVYGNIQYNDGGTAAGVIYCESGPCTISNVTGNISNNYGEGGIMFAFDGNGAIRNVGDIIGNSHTVIRASGTAEISNAGVIAYNEASTDGGVVRSNRAVFSNVTAIIGNKSFGYGGVAYVAEDATLTDIGTISNNVAYDAGGVVYVSGAGSVSLNASLISYNTCVSGAGGLVFINDSGSAAAGVLITNKGFPSGSMPLYGGIVGNSATHGALVYTERRISYVRIEHVGPVMYNECDDHLVSFGLPSAAAVPVYISDTGMWHHNLGGITYTGSSVSLTNVGGLYDNQLGGSSRTLLFASGDVDFENVGDITNHYSLDYAAVVYSRGNITMRNIGNVAYNESHYGDSGGVLYANGDITIEGIGSITFNEVYSMRAGPYCGFGGFAFANGDFRMQDVNGSIVGNVANYSPISYVVGTYSGNDPYCIGGGGGGLAYASSNATVRNVQGDIVDNHAFRGGVLLASNVNLASCGHIYLNSARNGGVIDAGFRASIFTTGDIYLNSAESGFDHNLLLGYGGVVHARTVRMEQVGAVHNNTATYYGGVAGAQTSVGEGDIIGAYSIYNNTALYGGGVLHFQSASIRDVEGDIVSNSAMYYDGGVIDATYATLDHVLGSASMNSAGRNGGVVYGSSTAQLLNVGELTYNTASYGGVVSGDTVTMSGVYGRIFSNSASYFGGVLFADYAEVSRVYGDVAENQAVLGGVAYADTSVSLRSVVGDIASNVAVDYGGVFYSQTCLYAAISRIDGSITNNSSNEGGGVIYARNGGHPSAHVRIQNVSGDISYNSSAVGGVIDSDVQYVTMESTGAIYNNTATRSDGSGGVVSAVINGELQVSFVGAISRNSAGYGGAFAAYGQVEVFTVVGDISDNTAAYEGGFVFSRSDVLVNSVLGGVHSNSAEFGGAVYSLNGSATLSNVSGSLAYNTGVGGVAMSLGSFSASSDAGIVITNVGNVVSNTSAFVTSGRITGNGIGNIVGNLNTTYSSVAYGYSAVLRNVGNIAYNYSSTEGAIYGYTQAEIAGAGYISYNDYAVLVGLYTRATDIGAVEYNTNTPVFIGLADAVVAGVNGNIEGNSGEDPVVTSINSLLRDVSGSISGNSALTGGVVFGSFKATLSNVTGPIMLNSASAGGVLYGAVVSISNCGLFYGNSSSIGGVAFASLSLVVENVYGFDGNSAADGGVAYAYGGSVSNVDLITNNSATSQGGAFYFSTNASAIHGVGTISGNHAQYGGVMFSIADSGLFGVGTLSDNYATADGGVVFSYNDVHLSDIDLIESNSASGDGGVVFGDVVTAASLGVVRNNSARYGGVIYSGVGSISGVDEISSNDASQDGGVIWSDGNGTISNVRGRICSNSASDDGGVIYASRAVLSSEPGASVAVINNHAGGDGGVVYGTYFAVVELTGGFLSGNTASGNGDVAASFGVVEVSATVDGQYGVSMEVLTQPSDGVERVPLPTQPVVELTAIGSAPSDVVPVTVQLLDEMGAVVEEYLPGDLPLDIADLTVGLVDFEVAQEGTYSLRFSVQEPNCESNSTVTVASVETEQFVIGECFTPSPASCPETHVSLNNEPGLCSALFNLTEPTTEECSSFDLSSSSDPEGPWAVGVNRFVWTIANDAGEEDRCVVDVTVKDVEAPTVNCTNVVVSTDPGQCSAIVEVPLPSFDDNCVDHVTITSDHPSPLFLLGDTPVIFTATDASGNKAQCVSVVSVVDTEAPVIFCPAPTSERECGANAVFRFPEVADNCPGPHVTQTAGVGEGEELLPGSNLFSFTAYDAAGQNVTCDFEVVTDGTWYFDGDSDGVGGGAPVFGCPSPGVGWIADIGGDCDDTRASLGLTVYADLDGDTWGSLTNVLCVEHDFFDSEEAIAKRSLDGVVFVGRTGDCDDANPLVNPGATEVCNEIDDNCNGLIDEGITCTGIQIFVSESTTTYPMPSIPVAPQAPPAPIIYVSLPTPLPTLPTPQVDADGDAFTDKRFTGLIAFRTPLHTTSGAGLASPAVFAQLLAVMLVLISVFMC